MSEERVHVHVRMRPALLRRIDHAAVDLGVKRSAAVEMLIEQALPERSDEAAAPVPTRSR